MASGRLAGSTYAESTKQAIVETVRRRPGCTGREIADALGLEKSRVNSFLYGEGKRRFHLVETHWRWYAPTSRPPRPPEPPGSRPPASPPSQSICGALVKMAESQAILKIRTFSLDIVELAFQEEDFSLLSDSLQAELATRRAVLLSQAPPARQGMPRWLLWALGFGALISVLNMMNTPRQVIPPSQNPAEEAR